MTETPEQNIWYTLVQQIAQRIAAKDAEIAYLCADCDTIGSDPRACEKCAGSSLLNLAKILNRETNENGTTGKTRRMERSNQGRASHAGRSKQVRTDALQPGIK